MRFHDGPGSDRPEKFLAVNARHGDGRRVVLDVIGEVDGFTAPLLQACVRTQLSRPRLRELILDMGGVEVLGVAGVSVVVEAGRRSRERGVRLRLRAHDRPQVVQPLEPTGVLDELWTVSQKVEARKRSVAHKAANRRSRTRGATGSAPPGSRP